MSDPRWEQIKRIVEDALDHAPSERAEFLDRACASDAALRSEVESLLAHEQESLLESGHRAGFAMPGTSPDGEPLAVGARLGPYEVRAPLGAGGMGEVYRARDERLHRDVALKLLPAQSFADHSARARLMREARSAAGLNHPHICTVFDVGEDDGRVYVAMELVEGEPLDKRLSRGPLDPDEATRYAIQLADAVSHAHDRGIIHRDLKSANTVIGADGRAKVLDFGLAKRLQEPLQEETNAMTATQPGTVMGTLAYMPPEQLRGEAADARSDIWALGVVFFEMVAGERPFSGATGFEVSSAILKEAPRQFPTVVSPALERVIRRCLEKDPDDRYQNATELVAALTSARSGGGADDSASSAAKRVRAWYPTAAAAVLALAIAGVGLDVGGVRSSLFDRIGGPAIESLVVLPLTNLSGDPEQEFLADGMTEALIAELSKLQGLSVVSRTSAMQLKDTDKPLRQIIDEFGVDGAIEGGVLQEDGLVRITINLIDGDTDRTLWSQSFERESTGVLVLHSEMVRAIADGVELTLSPQEEALLAVARPVNPEAYEAYLKGRMHWYKQTPMDVDRALQYFELAEQKDPDFALAYLGMGYVWTYYASVGLMPPGEMAPRVMEALRKARDIDPTLAETFEAEADYKFYYDWDWEGAERDYKRAIELKPNSAEMRLYYWDFLVAMKRPREARVQIERCLELDPFNSFVQMSYGLFLIDVGRYDDAVDQFQQIIRTDTDFGPARLALWKAYHHLGRFDEALASLREYFMTWGDEEMAEALDAGFDDGGYQGAMRRAAEQKVERSGTFHVLASEVAALFAYAGDEPKTLDWLERAFEERETGLVKLQIDPDWDSVRDEPRFQVLLAAMNFPPS